MRRPLWLATASFLLAASLEASIVLPASLDELALEAEAIVLAHVTQVGVRQDAVTRRVERVATIEVLRSLKGSWPRTLHVRVPGGTLGRYRTIVPGSPSLAPGEEGIFFLRADGADLPFILGLSQGLYRVSRDAAGGRIVRPPIEERITGPIVRGSVERSPVPLERFEARLARMLLADRPGEGARR
ncbi:MAG TPA: hypothetical protein VIL35_01235 [Vicinamibacterales bacterium]